MPDSSGSPSHFRDLPNISLHERGPLVFFFFLKGEQASLTLLGWVRYRDSPQPRKHFPSESPFQHRRPFLIRATTATGRTRRLRGLSLLSPDWPVSGAGDRLPGVGVWRGWGAGGPTHLRFIGRTLTATLTDAMAHHGPARGGSHQACTPRPPATPATVPEPPPTSLSPAPRQGPTWSC